MLQSFVKSLKSLVAGRGGPALSPEEKRNLIRVRCRLPVMVSDGTEEGRQATVTDISLNGMRVKVSNPPKGSDLYVSHPLQGSEFEVETVRCQIMWSRKRRFSGDVVVGLKFNEDPQNLAKSWVRYILRAIGLDERAIYQRRKFIRADSSLPADIESLESFERLADGNAINLGIGGMLFQTLDPLDRDAAVSITIGPMAGLPPLKLQGIVLGKMEDPEGKYNHYSVRFTDIEDQQLENLGKFVIALLKESSGLYGR